VPFHEVEMAKRSKRSTADIKRLLDEQRQVAQWLERLDMAADKTPDQVRHKVRADYAKRRDAIVEELQGMRAELTAALEEQQKARDELASQEAAVSERMAEAELRHTVGEFGEAKWSELRSGILESLVKIREELKGVEEEIAGIEEVMGVVDAGEPEPETPEPPEAPPAVIDEMPPAIKELSSEHSAEPAAEPATPAGSGKRDSSATPAEGFDELAFLRSVTEEEERRPRTSRVSGTLHRVSTPDLASPVPVDEAAAPPVDSTTRSERASLVGAEGVGPVTEQDRPSKGSAKTVTCGECGAQNLPTEWYCERCGAELAAL
jgi:hypothetical protein